MVGHTSSTVVHEYTANMVAYLSINPGFYLHWVLWTNKQVTHTHIGAICNCLQFSQNKLTLDLGGGDGLVQSKTSPLHAPNQFGQGVETPTITQDWVMSTHNSQSIWLSLHSVRSIDSTLGPFDWFYMSATLWDKSPTKCIRWYAACAGRDELQACVVLWNLHVFPWLLSSKICAKF